MKKLNKSVMTVLICPALNIQIAFGQATSSNGVNTPVGTNNYLGWAAGVNLPLDIKTEDAEPLRFYTNAGSGSLNNLRMFIEGGNGRVHISTSLFIDVDDGNFGTLDHALRLGFNSGEGIGSRRTAGGNQFGLDFYTNFINRMIIQNDGRVGINTMVIAPNSQFEVNNDINLTSSVLNHGYRIEGIIVLQKPGINNTYVGEGAGVNSPLLTPPSDNTFVGFNAGNSNNNQFGNANTFVGSQAGLSNTTGRHNAFVGYQAGSSNTTGRWNTFMGMLAGSINTTGESNSFYGKQAGRQNNTGSGNCFFGSHTAHQNISGSYNVAVGINAGTNFNLVS